MTHTAPRVIPVILSGGSGTRLWPLSQPDRPKQFLPLTAPETMLQLTAARVADPRMFDPPIIVSSDRHAAEIETQLGSAGVDRIILEPAQRNTAPAIALAALAAPAGALLLVLPSDHLIADAPSFLAAVASLRPFAEGGRLATFGIRADRPETGYGYLRRGAALAPGVFEVTEFIEKPTLEVAKRYVAEGNFDWNGGIFLFRADALLSELELYAPAVIEAARAAMADARGQGRRVHPAAEAFAAAPSISIDHAVMERSDRVVMASVEMGWSDLGSWDALHDNAEADAAGNVVDERSIAIGTSNCLFRSEGPRIAAVGVDDLIVVATADCVLVTRRGQSQRVKEVVDALSREASQTTSPGRIDPPA